MKKLAVTICATKKYSYAVNAQAYSLQSAIFEYLRSKKQEVLQVVIILVSEGCDKLKKLENGGQAVPRASAQRTTNHSSSAAQRGFP